MRRPGVGPKTPRAAGPSSSTAPKRPVGDGVNHAQVEQAKQYFSLLEKSLKTIILYLHNTRMYDQYVEAPFRVLTQILERHDSMALKVASLSFIYNEEPVYEAEATEQNLAYQFHRDGVRILVFRKGLKLEEFLRFVLVCAPPGSALAVSGEDSVSRLWKEQFQHIEYVVTESFAVANEGEGQAAAEIDKIFQHLHGCLASRSKDTFSHAQLSMEDLDIELTNVERAQGVVVRGTSTTREEKEKFQQILLHESASRLMSKLAELLFRLLETGMEKRLMAPLCEAFTTILDDCILHENFHGVFRMLERFSALERNVKSEEQAGVIQFLQKHLRSKMVEPARIQHIGKVLDRASKILHPEHVRAYLDQLDEEGVVPLLETLESLESTESRQLFCEALAHIGQNHQEMFERRLTAEKSTLVRDMMYIIDKMNPKHKAKILSKVLSSGNMSLQMEFIRLVGKGEDPEGLNHLLDILKQEDPKLRMAVLKQLTNFDLRAQAKKLLGLVQDPEFMKRSFSEQAAFYGVLATTNAERVMRFLHEQLRDNGTLFRKKTANQKLAIVKGLAMSNTLSVYNFLRDELKTRFEDKELHLALMQASQEVKLRILASDEGQKHG